MSQRFFSDTPITGDAAALTGTEAHHLLHVMRAKEGDEVTLFDGSGAEFEATIAKCGRAEVLCQVLEKHEIDRELPFALTLGVAMPKGDRQKWLIEKTVELGVTCLVPLITDQTIVKVKSSALEKLRRGVIEASKQCGRNRLMSIDEPMLFADFLKQTDEEANAKETTDKLIAHPAIAHPGGVELSSLRTNSGNDAVVVIGPEGGFTDEEVSQATSDGWKPISLGTRILRIETAALAIAAKIVG